MSHFEESYDAFRYPLMSERTPGFRVAQLGALHAAASHFANRTEPGIVTMPTGSGKTAVLIAAAYVLRSKRALVITPSRLVREQIAEEISTLVTLKEAGALPQTHPGPRVMSTRSKVRSVEEWEEMRNFDIIVATVQSISPEFEGIPEPPLDLFDLVLVDEAHHSPARTWQAVLDHFVSAKRLLFTATPFRQDQKEIKGRFIFTYDLRSAYSDGVFGDISYLPVAPQAGESHDEAIAKAAETQLRADERAGYRHRVMVRTDALNRAQELLALYEETTNLRLNIITGNHSLRYVKQVIKQLREGELDGIVCVNMLGEGFNFPGLKIAAIHAPHKSLSVTLQFVGRFARTVGENLGPASFIAVPSDVEIEAERLYDTRAVWQEIIQNLAALRVGQETDAREVLQSFAAIEFSPDLSDLSLYVLEPYYHVKVYQLEEEIDIEEQIEFPSRLQIVFHAVSVPHNAAIYITREISQPRWTADERLSNVESDLFIFYYDPGTKLLFVCASKRPAGLYDEIMEAFIDSDPRPLPLVRLNKALNDLTAPEFFNVGMRNRVSSNTTESYRIITGSNADKSVLKSDSRLYHRGHVFGRATEEGNSVTIGLSSASKIWSNKSSKLPELIDWCAKLARKISSNRIPITNSGLDFLDAGEQLEHLPENIVAIDWPSDVYRNSISTRFHNSVGKEIRAPLVDFDLSIDKPASTTRAIMIQLKYDDTRYRFTFSFHTDRFFELVGDGQPEINVEKNRAFFPLIDYLNDVMLLFYTGDLSLIDGYNIFRASTELPPPLNDDAIEMVNWAAGNVNIQREFGDAGVGCQSIHAYIESILNSGDSDVAYYDHGTGEIADFITLKQADGRILVRFYHCKGATAAAPGHRLADIGEVTSQVVKSVTWARKQRIVTKHSVLNYAA
ncbi:MAG: DEAD/DEAH box helicase [Nitrospiraceae bacterium]